MLGALAAKPGLAQLLTGDAMAVEPQVVERYRRATDPRPGGALERERRARRQPHTDPRLAFGQAQVLILNQIATGKPDRLLELLPEIVYLAVSPYGGHEEALRQSRWAGEIREPRCRRAVTDSPEDLRQWRLPRGRHGLPRELVERSQRERLLAAVVRVTVAKGYESTTVGDILGEAGVGRESFYELFDDKLDCMLAAHKILADDLEERVRAAYLERGALAANGCGARSRRRSSGSPPTRRRRASSWSS